MTRKNNDFEDVLQDPELRQEIGADELAVHTAGLTHPNDLELERILAEDWDSVPDHEEPPITPEEALNRFLYEEDDGVSPVEETPAAELQVEEPTRIIPAAEEAVAQEEIAVVEEEVYEEIPEEEYEE